MAFGVTFKSISKLETYMDFEGAVRPYHVRLSIFEGHGHVRELSGCLLTPESLT